MPVTVHDRQGRLVTSLAVDDFEVLEGSRPVPISVFTNEPQPLTLLLMFDTSTSASPNITHVRRAALAAIEALHPGDRARIGTFGVEIAVSPHLTGDTVLLSRIIREEIWPSYASRVWDATYRGLETLASDSGPRRTLILLTDGADTARPNRAGTSPAKSVDDVHRRARSEDWTIYAVVPGSSASRGLQSLVNDTGGRLVARSGERDLPAQFTALMAELRQQYVLGFASTRTDGQVHSIEVRTRNRDLRVTARRSYLSEKR